MPSRDGDRAIAVIPAYGQPDPELDPRGQGKHEPDISTH